MGHALDKKLGLYINVAAMVSLIASVLTIYFFVGALNRNALRTDTQLLTSGLEYAAERNETWAADYGWWNELLQVLDRGDVNMLGTGLASSFSDHAGFDFIVVADESRGQVHSWHRDSGRKLLSDLLEMQHLVDMREDLQAGHPGHDYLASQYIRIDDRFYLISGTVIGEFDDRRVTDPVRAPLLIIGAELDKGFFNDMEAQFLIEEIRFVPGTGDAIEGAVPIRDAEGRQLAQLVWTPSEPGVQTLRVALVPLIAYVLVFLVASQVIAWHARKLVRRAEENERRAKLAASTDSLSQLPNRHGFVEFIESSSVEHAARHGEAAVIYLDLNGFKAVNDKAGHHAGDEVIRIVARRFRDTLPGTVMAARMGGDEFACVLIGSDQVEQALPLARQLSEAFNEPVEIHGQKFDIGAAIGISSQEAGTAKSIEDLVNEADMAMYRAKSDQLREPLCYDVTLGLEHHKRRTLECDIERGIAQGEFFVVYQPIVDAQTGEVQSVEALLRWDQPERGSVPPDVFIPIAERSKLITELGDLVLDSICRDIGPDASYSVSVNLSPRQLGDPDLAERVLGKLALAGMSATQIEFELTEAVLVEDFDKARFSLEQLAAAGFRINLDDFGTGFAGVGYLHKLPFNKIKIDKSFVRAIGKGEDHNKFLQALSLLGDALHLDIVAEGVETESQASLLRLLGIKFLQGWHFGRPMEPGALRRFHPPRPASKTAGG